MIRAMTRRWSALLALALVAAPLAAHAQASGPDLAGDKRDDDSKKGGGGGGRASSLTGTTWSGTDSDGDAYTFTFEPNGRLRYTSPSGSYFQPQDTWSQSGNRVTMKMNDGYAVYEGVISGNVIDGKSTNVTGKKWTWRISKR